MFLHQSNTLHLLMDQLRGLVAEPRPDPFEPEIIVVQNQGMAQWVAQQLAFATGIAAHLSFPLPARCIWEIYRLLGGADREEEAFRRPVLHWRIFHLLLQFKEHPAFGEVRTYLQGDPDGTKRYQLAGTISDVFDQYLIYRPDMLDAWHKQQETDDWQALLWRQLTEVSAPSQVLLPDSFCQLLVAAEPAAGLLPRRIHLFGINSLAPIYLDIFVQLGRYTEVHLFHLSPCRHYWADLQAPRQEARQRQKNKAERVPSIPEPWPQDDGNPLLLSLGKTGQDFFRQLLAYDLEDVDLYQRSDRDHLLATLQGDLLELRNRAAGPEERFPLQPGDRSVQFHVCHSPLREIQNLHDRLLDLFTDMPDLYPGDILVTAPDIRKYSSAIAAVFGGAAPELRIPYSLADLSACEEQPAVQCFLELLALLAGRFNAQDVLALCESELLLRRFGMDTTQLPRLHNWVRDSGIRWGMDEAHRQQLGVEAGGQCTWQFGLDRMLLGYLTGDSAQPCNGLTPYGRISGQEAELLGSFIALIQQLAGWRVRFQQHRTLADWCQCLIQLLTDFFDPETQDQGVAILHDTISAIQTDGELAGLTESVAPSVIRRCLEQALSQPGGGQAFLSGRITFCNMVPMRSVPFRVIWILGLNDQEFPRSQYPIAFSRITQQPRLGDRHRRDDDRYLFLESLLSARDVLGLSWVGRNLRDNSFCPPSTVVSELQDFINQSCVSSAGVVSELLTTVHPLQPFSPACFNGTRGTASYNRTWLPAAGQKPLPSFLSCRLPEPDPEWFKVDIGQFIRFWRHPTRFFLQQILGMRLGFDRDYSEESEPFTLDALEQFRLRQDMVSAMLRQQSADQLYERLAGSGSLPQSMFGHLEFDELVTTGKGFAAVLAPLVAQPRPALEIDCLIDSFHLSGWLGDLYSSGRVTWRSAQLKGATLMEVWINHLLLCLAAPPGQPLISTHLAKTDSKQKEPVSILTFRPVATPEILLRQLLAAYWRGLSEPLPFFPKTSLAYASADPEKAMLRARQCWTGGYQHPGEGDEPEYSSIMRQADPLNEDFIALSALYHPVFEHLEQGHAGA